MLKPTLQPSSTTGNTSLAALDNPSSGVWASAPDLLDHLRRVRDNYAQVVNATRSAEAQAARFLLHGAFNRHGGSLRALIQLYFPLNSRTLSSHGRFLDKYLLARNLHLATGIDTASLGEDFEMNWSEISASHPLSPAQLQRCADSLDWDEVACNPLINWNPGLIRKYQQKTNSFFELLSTNRGVNWSYPLVTAFAYKWDASTDGLLNNEGLFWDDTDALEKVEIFNNNWTETLQMQELMLEREWERRSADRHFRWTLDYLREHADQFDWTLLSANPGLPFTFDLLQEFAGRWNWEELGSNHGLYEQALSPWLSDMVVNELLVITAL